MPSEARWSPSEVVPGALPGSRWPALAAIADTLHCVWAQQRVLYHAVRSGTEWTQPVRVATGEQPALAVAPDGKLHCVFSNQFAGNYEVYYTRWNGTAWALPQPVSRTTGASRYPAVAASQAGSLHAVWADTTPGYSVIYEGRLGRVFWTSLPVPSGRGNMPALAITPQGNAYVAWQDRLSDTGRYGVLSSILSDGKWSLPEFVSDTPTAHSLFPQLAANPQGRCHVVWQGERDASRYTVYHCDRRTGGWSEPAAISAADSDCRLPRIAANRQGYLQAVWLQGNRLCHRVRPPEPEANWWAIETAEGVFTEASDLSIAIGWSGALHVVWSGMGSSGSQLFHTRREPVFKHTILLPIA